MRPDVLALLRLANPWLDDPSAFEAAVEARLPPILLDHAPGAPGPWPDPRRAHVLTGARQTGKTTWLWRRFREAATPPLFLNAEEPLIRGWAASPEGG